MTLRIFNLHQQKAAGKTVESALERRLGQRVARVSKVFPEVVEGDISLYRAAWQARPEAIGPEVRVVTGHLYYGLHEACRSHYCYTTVIREPISRMKSYFNYVMNGAEDYFLRKYLLKHELDFEAFIRIGDTVFPPDCPSDIAIIADNGQSRLIHGTPRPLGYQMTQAEFDTVQDNIAQDFALLAPAARASEFAVCLLWLAGTRPPTFLPRVNTRTKDWVGEIPVKSRYYLAERHHFDAKLHRQAEVRFSEDASTLASRLVARIIERSGEVYSNYWKPWKQAR